MDEAEFRLYLEAVHRDYAADLVSSTGVSEEEAAATAAVHLEAPPEEFHAPVRLCDAGTGSAVGRAWVLVADGDAFLADFRIAEEHRGKGYARAAMAELEQWAREAGAEQIRLHVFAANERARDLYERNGFETVSLQMRKRIDPA